MAAEKQSLALALNLQKRNAAKKAAPANRKAPAAPLQDMEEESGSIAEAVMKKRKQKLAEGGMVHETLDGEEDPLKELYAEEAPEPSVEDHSDMSLAARARRRMAKSGV